MTSRRLLTTSATMPSTPSDQRRGPAAGSGAAAARGDAPAPTPPGSRRERRAAAGRACAGPRTTGCASRRAGPMRRDVRGAHRPISCRASPARWTSRSRTSLDVLPRHAVGDHARAPARSECPGQQLRPAAAPRLPACARRARRSRSRRPGCSSGITSLTSSGDGASIST